MKKIVLKLTEEDRSSLQSSVVKGRVPGYEIKRALVLLACDCGDLGPCWPDGKIVEAYDVSIRSIQNWRKAAIEKGAPSALKRKKREVGPRPLKFKGREEAHLIALACSDPPEGHARWSLRLLADRVVELRIVDSASHELVRRTLKKTNLSLGKR